MVAGSAVAVAAYLPLAPRTATSGGAAAATEGSRHANAKPTLMLLLSRRPTRNLYAPAAAPQPDTLPPRLPPAWGSARQPCAKHAARGPQRLGPISRSYLNRVGADLAASVADLYIRGCACLRQGHYSAPHSAQCFSPSRLRACGHRRGIDEGHRRMWAATRLQKRLDSFRIYI